MASKFGRNYVLEVATIPEGNSPVSELITVRPPFTVEFDITRNTLTSVNVCQLRIYNLSRVNRDRLNRNVTNWGKPFQAVKFQAGYGDDLATIFAGNVTQCWSVREGTNFITQIECFDGGYAYINGTTNDTFSKSKYPTQRDLIVGLASTLPFISVGSIGDFSTKLTRDLALSGNTVELLSQISGGTFFVDNEYANALGTDEYIDDGGVIVVDASTGLLGTPVLEQSIIRFDMIFEPKLNVGRLVKLDSTTAFNSGSANPDSSINSSFNGEYLISAVKHRGMISDAVCGSAITTGQFSKFGNPIPVVPE